MDLDELPTFVLDHLRCIAKKEGFTDGYEIKHQSGSNVGDGFMATLVSVKLIGSRQNETAADLVLDELSLICKLPPGNETRQEHFGSDRLFRQEVFAFNVVLPSLTAFQEECGLLREDMFTSFPKCYVAFHGDENQPSLIIMEDLRASGFEMYDKSKPMDFETVRLLVEQIGRLHGLSFAIRDQKPELFQKFQNIPPILFDYATTPGTSAILQSSFEQAALLMDNEDDSKALDRVAELTLQFLSDSENLEILGKYGVVSHGDCWINNMMFRIDRGSPKSISLLDWQLSRFTSPAIDLVHFIFSATDKSLRDTHLEDFLHIYYTSLAGIIRATGSDPDVLFPEDELRRQLLLFGGFGVILGPVLIPLILAQSSEIPNYDIVSECIADGAANTATIKRLTEAKIEEVKKRIQDVIGDTRRYGWFFESK